MSVAALTAVCSLLAGQAAAQPADVARVRLIGALQSQSVDGRANSMSSDGRIVVGRSTSQLGPEGFAWIDPLRGGRGTIALGALPSASPFGFASDVADDGSLVVGGSIDIFGVQRGVLWMQPLGVQPLPIDFDIPGSLGSTARSISADGTIFSGEITTSQGIRAYRFTPATGLRPLGGELADAFFSVAGGLSRDGRHVVGQFSLPFGGFSAYRWSDGPAGPVVTLIADLPGGQDTAFANGVSDDGTIVIGTGTTATGSQGFRWIDPEAGGPGTIPLGELIPGAGSEALACSADGRIIVGSAPSSITDTSATYWRPETGLIDLDAFLRDLGVPLGPTRLVTATSISADGTRVGGIARTSEGAFSAFIAEVPLAGCLRADFVEPFGVRSNNDVQAFVDAFFAGEPRADLAEPFGVVSQADVNAFVDAFFESCLPAPVAPPPTRSGDWTIDDLLELVDDETGLRLSDD
ncbi:MAG: GC-type dockerin domain-anchored protein [Planctomycetota bacterium]